MPLARSLQRYPSRNASTGEGRHRGPSKLILGKENYVAGHFTRNSDGTQ